MRMCISKGCTCPADETFPGRMRKNASLILKYSLHSQRLVTAAQATEVAVLCGRDIFKITQDNIVTVFITLRPVIANFALNKTSIYCVQTLHPSAVMIL